MSNFFQELKRRKVFKVAAAYAVVAWVLIQVSGEILPTFEAPAWVQQTITFLFFLGFPVAVVLAWAYEITPDGARRDTAGEVSASTGNATDRKLIYVILGMVTLLGGFQVSERLTEESSINAVTSAGAGIAADTAPSTLSRRYRIDLGATIPRPGPATRAQIELSRDGSRLAFFVMRPGGDRVSQLLELDALDPVPLPGSERLIFTGNLFFSPDAEQIAFAGDNSLYLITARAGTSRLLQDSIYGGYGGYWGDDGFIYYIPDNGQQIMRVPAVGGAPQPLSFPPEFEATQHGHPVLLPDGRSLLFNSSPRNLGAREGQVVLYDLETSQARVIIEGGYSARYASSGHLVFIRGNSLWAVPFDLGRLATTGPEVPVIQGVETEGGRGSAIYAFSDEGTLVYLPGADTTIGEGVAKTLVWVDDAGNEEELAERRDFRLPAVSPDGRRLATVVLENNNLDIWTYDLDRDIVSRLTFDDALDNYPLWSPDGEYVIFGSSREGGDGLWRRAADGTGQVELLLNMPGVIPWAITPDGGQLVFDAGGDLYVLEMDGSGAYRPLLQTDATETRADLSPDGRWIAFESDETGRMEIYVRPFPNVDDGRWQVSSQGGVWPRWHPDGDRLFYRLGSTGSTNVWAVGITTDSSIQFGTPVLLISDGDYRGTGPQGAFDLSGDGSRYLMLQAPRTDSSAEDDFSAATTQLVVVDNWFEELRRLAPP